MKTKKQNRICVIFTGGTIGSSSDNGTVDLDGGSSALLINKYKAVYGGSVIFEEYRPVDILSENILKSDIEKIADSVRNADLSSFDGMIVTHGTDTLCFTANCFAQIFADISVPLVFVGALYPLDDERGNGLDNFAAAVTFIENVGIKGVYVSFRNAGEQCKIHLASRVVEPDQLSGKLRSLFDVHFGEIVDGRFVYNENAFNPTPESVLANAPAHMAEWSLCGDIVTVSARALLDFSCYRFCGKLPKAVIVRLYHSGTACTAGKDTDINGFLGYCRSLGIETVLAPVDSKANVYAGMLGMEEKCILAYDMSFEMTVVKVMLALGSGIPIRALLGENRFFEKVR